MRWLSLLAAPALGPAIDSVNRGVAGSTRSTLALPRLKYRRQDVWGIHMLQEQPFGP